MAVEVGLFFVSVECTVFERCIYASVRCVGSVVWCRRQQSRSTRVMVVCCGGALGVKVCYVFFYMVLSTMAVLDDKCKRRVANDWRQQTLIVVIGE